MPKCEAAHLTHCRADARCDDVVVRMFLLHHQPHRLDIVTGEAPVPLCVEVSEPELLLHTQLYSRDRVGHLAGYELNATQR